MNISIIYNPTAGRRRRRYLARVLRLLRAAGHTVRLLPTAAPGHATELAGTAAAADRIVVAGGDGTMNEVLNGLPDDAPPVAFLPMGTANVLAFELGLPFGASAAARTIAEGLVVPVQVATAGDRRFLLMASVGIDAWTVAMVDGGLKRRIGAAAYLYAALRGARAYRFPPLSVEVDGARSTAHGAVVARAGRYGGPFRLAPDLSFDRPGLSVVTLGKAGAFASFGYGVALVLGRLHRCRSVRVVQGSRIRIDGPAGLPVQADGDRFGTLPIEVALAPVTVGLVRPLPAVP